MGHLVTPRWRYYFAGLLNQQALDALFLLIDSDNNTVFNLLFVSEAQNKHHVFSSTHQYFFAMLCVRRSEVKVTLLHFLV